MQKSTLMDDQKKAVIWQEWEKGTPMITISRATEKPPATVYSYLQYHGGIQPRQRRRCLKSLSLEEREDISRGLAIGRSLRSIADFLLRCPSTISREVHRNGGIHRYRATVADKSAWKRAKRPKPCLLAQNIRLKRLVAAKLGGKWSPEQITGWLKLTYPDDKGLRVSHETIYKSLFIQTRGLFRKELRNHLRTKRKFRHAKKHKPATGQQILAGVSIRERPACVEDRAVPGHWEGDLICGSKNSYIATVVERQSRFTILVKVEGKKTEGVVSALSRQMAKLPELLKQSLTWDRGTELAAHRKFSVATNMDVYFCDPCSPSRQIALQSPAGQCVAARYQ